MVKRARIPARLFRIHVPTIAWSDASISTNNLEDSRVLHRINDLRQVPAKIRFLSVEPLIGPIEHMDATGIHWVIVGGESGPGARPMAPEWVHGIRDQCIGSGVAFFFKQWGGVQKFRTGRELNGRTWDEYPVIFEEVGGNRKVAAGP